LETGYVNTPVLTTSLPAVIMISQSSEQFVAAPAAATLLTRVKRKAALLFEQINASATAWQLVLMQVASVL
jgi:hypothetical protein